MGQSWEDRHALAIDVFVPWIEQVKTLRGARVLEFGSGKGAAALAWARAGADVFGVDIIGPDTNEARSRAAELGLKAQFADGTYEEIIAMARDRTGKVDVFMLYAVLEHMTPMERIYTLRVAKEILAPDGIIVVAESPNRVHWLDEHTTTLPFFDQLPDELAFMAAGRIPREGIKENFIGARGQSTQDRSVTRARLGRGIGFQEFEMVFGDLDPVTMHCNWEPRIMTSSQGVRREQLALARFMDQNSPHIPPSFSRYYIDLILQPQGGKPFPYVRPLPLATEGGVHAQYTRNEHIHIAPGGSIEVALPSAVSGLVLGVTVYPGMADNGVRFAIATVQSRQEHETRKYDPALTSWVSYEDIALGAEGTVRIEAGDFMEISFIGYRKADSAPSERSS